MSTVFVVAWWLKPEFRSSSIRLAIGEIVDIVLRILELLLLGYGLCGNDFSKTL
jgi:hypothetical protein